MDRVVHNEQKRQLSLLQNATSQRGTNLLVTFPPLVPYHSTFIHNGKDTIPNPTPDRNPSSSSRSKQRLPIILRSSSSFPSWVFPSRMSIEIIRC